jgi:hypothetical protein
MPERPAALLHSTPPVFTLREPKALRKSGVLPALDKNFRSALLKIRAPIKIWTVATLQKMFKIIFLDTSLEK